MIHRLLYIALFWHAASSSSFASLEEMIYKPWTETTPRPTVVLDIDMVVCYPAQIHSDDLNYATSKAYKRYPEVIMIPYYESEDRTTRGWHTHIFFPGMPELILKILSWGWDVHFFSASLKRRNDKIIPMYLKEAFRSYFSNIDEVLATLLHQRIKIFSKNKLMINYSGCSLRTAERTSRIHYKDLTKIDLDPEHAILVDDKPEYAVNIEQQPLIVMSAKAASRFANQVLKINDSSRTETEPDASANASYILGILDVCRLYMASNSVGLRAALREVLRIPYGIEGAPAIPFLPCWPSHWRNPMNPDDPFSNFHKAKIQDFIKAGGELIQEMVSSHRRGPIHSAISQKPYHDLLLREYKVGDHTEDPTLAIFFPRPLRSSSAGEQLYQATPLVFIVLVLISVNYYIWWC